MIYWKENWASPWVVLWRSIWIIPTIISFSLYIIFIFIKEGKHEAIQVFKENT